MFCSSMRHFWSSCSCSYPCRSWSLSRPFISSMPSRRVSTRASYYTNGVRRDHHRNHHGCSYLSSYPLILSSSFDCHSMNKGHSRLQRLHISSEARAAAQRNNQEFLLSSLFNVKGKGMYSTIPWKLVHI